MEAEKYLHLLLLQVLPKIQGSNLEIGIVWQKDRNAMLGTNAVVTCIAAHIVVFAKRKYHRNLSLNVVM